MLILVLVIGCLFIDVLVCLNINLCWLCVILNVRLSWLLGMVVFSFFVFFMEDNKFKLFLFVIFVKVVVCVSVLIISENGIFVCVLVIN